MTCRCHAYPLDGPLTCAEKSLAVQALDFAISAFEQYQGYPSAEAQRQRIEEAKAVRSKLRALHKSTGDKNG